MAAASSADDGVDLARHAALDLGAADVEGRDELAAGLLHDRRAGDGEIRVLGHDAEVGVGGVPGGVIVAHHGGEVGPAVGEGEALAQLTAGHAGESRGEHVGDAAAAALDEGEEGQAGLLADAVDAGLLAHVAAAQGAALHRCVRGVVADGAAVDLAEAGQQAVAQRARLLARGRRT